MAAEVLSAVAKTARMLARMGLVEAFGHVSARLAEGDFALTSTSPLMAQDAATVLRLDADAQVVEGNPAACPLEAPMHAGVYALRSDVGAICRTHSRHAAVWASQPALPPVVHGLGGLSGALALHDQSDLITTRQMAEAVAADLGGGSCVLLRGNGAVCVGADLGEATVRAWYLEQRAELASLAPNARPLLDQAALARARHYPAELARARRWVERRFAEPAEARA